MCEFWYDYVEPKYDEKAKLCYMGTDSYIVHVKIDNLFTDITEDVETRFDPSYYELECNLSERLVPKGKIKK